jgi:DNA-binding SARP family transcriptional activator
MDTASAGMISNDERSWAGMRKITMPSMPTSYPLTARYRRLDQLQACSLLWVAAPAGYGKSTLLSGYLRLRRRPAAWYQCDEGDADIASFFHFVSLAYESISAAPRQLPRFVPQYSSALQTFARNFFRHWFSGLSPGSTLVLDNWQDVPPGSRLTQLLETIAGEAPAGVQVFVLSRYAPDAALSRLLASERMAVLGINDLQLSKAETRAIARGRGRSMSAKNLESLYRLTQGWAAGVTLLLRHPWTDTLPRQPHNIASDQSVFGYFAAEAYGRLPERVREFLLTVVCLEHITTPLARRVSGSEDAGNILDELVHQNAFTVYRSDSDSYHLHPLFREFLQRQWRQRPAQEQRAAQLNTARALRELGDREAALRLYMLAQAWPDVVQLLRQFAPVLVRDARLETLQAKIEALPVEWVCRDGWIVYWRGVCRNTLDFAAARADFERAHELFQKHQDAVGEMLAASAVLMHITFSYLDYGQMLPWIARLEGSLGSTPTFDDPSVELQIRTAFMTALSQALPSSCGLVDSVDHVFRLVSRETNVAMRAEAVAALMLYFARFGQTSQYGELDHHIEALLKDDALPPLHRQNLIWLKAYKLHAAGETAQVMSLLAEARALARQQGMHAEDARMSVCELQAQSPDATPSAALQCFSSLEPYVASMPPITRAHFLYVRAVFELACGHLREALNYAEASLPLVRACHWHIGEALSLVGLAEVYCCAGRLEDAWNCVAECDQLLAEIDAPLVRFNVGLARTEILRLRGVHGAYVAELTDVMRLGRRQGYANGFHTSSQLLDHLIPEAFALGIEPGYCRWVIGKRRLAPPSPQCLAWPWSVKVRTLGGFKVEVGNSPPQFEGKVQRKPIELLKLLATRSEGVQAAVAMDTIWPELDGDAARNALDLALHRLRKMLACKHAVITNNGALALNLRVVWLDVAALDALRASIDTNPRAAAEQVLKIYQGPYLAGEEVQGPYATARLQLRKTFTRVIVRLGKQFEKAGQGDAAQRLYERALEVEAIELRVCQANAQGAREADVVLCVDGTVSQQSQTRSA